LNIKKIHFPYSRTIAAAAIGAATVLTVGGIGAASALATTSSHSSHDGGDHGNNQCRDDHGNDDHGNNDDHGDNRADVSSDHTSSGDHGNNDHCRKPDLAIHDSKTSEHNPHSDYKVCGFYLEGFNFDHKATISWSIKMQPASPPVNLSDNSKPALHGVLKLDSHGHGRTEDLTLDNGKYVLFWKTVDKYSHIAKKYFKVDCPPDTTSTPPASPPPSDSGGDSAPVPVPVPSDLAVTG
jgi:hypothetical protein